MNKLNQEFNDTVEALKVKLQEAAKAMREANELREKANLPTLVMSVWVQDDLSNDECEELDAKLKPLYNDISALESELNDAGWSTSSSYC